MSERAGWLEIATDGLFQVATGSSVLRLRKILPSSGSTAGGTTVELYLEALGSSITSVTVGGASATIVSKTDTLVTITTPAGTAGFASIVASTGSLTDTLTNAFTYYSGTVNSPAGDFLRAVETKLKTSQWITSASNVIIGESLSLLDLADSAFPRLEVLVTKDKANGYQSQRNIDFEFRYAIAGHIRRSTDAVSFSDMEALMNWGTEIRALNYQFLNDKQTGNPPCAGFSRMAEFPEIFYEFELFPKISSFLMDIGAFLYLTDTQTA